MSEKQQAGLAARKEGTYVAPVQLTQPAVSKLISDGLYKVTYDGAGLQQAGASASNPDSTWYNFTISNADGVEVGYYHVHPTLGGGYASGNLRIKDSSSFGSYLVGRATDWKWLTEKMASKIA